jgi:hypothetical protein
MARTAGLGVLDDGLLSWCVLCGCVVMVTPGMLGKLIGDLLNGD